MINRQTSVETVSSLVDIQRLQHGVLHVKGNDLKDAEVLKLTEFESIETLNLSGCELITNEAVIGIQKLVRLEDLDLSLCSLITDRGVLALANLAALRRVSLNWCYNITDAALLRLAETTSLEAISLWSCEEITDIGVKALSRLPRLEWLELPEFAEITDVALRELSGNASSLHVLRLDHLAAVSDDGIRSLGKILGLSRLTIKGCLNVTKAGIAALQLMLPNCQIIFS